MVPPRRPDETLNPSSSILGNNKKSQSLSLRRTPTMILTLVLISVLLIVVASPVQPAHAVDTLFACTTGALMGSNETPPNASTATGTIDITVDTSTNTVFFTLTF